MYQKYLDPVVETFTAGDYYKEVFQAKQEYFERAGVVYEDDSEYENRMNTFMDWYLFDRELPGIDLPPIKLYFRKNEDRFTKEEAGIYKGFCNTILSIFYLRKASGGCVFVKDLFSRKNYEVRDGEINAGFMKGDIFEGRLIPFQGIYEFSKGFCFHPVEMEKFILGEIKKVRNQDKARQTKLILRLSAMKLKQTRYQHINIKHIYTFDPKF
ncbi:MAG: hypothetical protein HYW49_02585 [Deltaproteobacteria bacterium]|nr:hypothetical protein [Deltaproteobacteria bacterium]